MPSQKNADELETDSLEATSTVVEPKDQSKGASDSSSYGSGSDLSGENLSSDQQTTDTKLLAETGRLRRFFGRFNIYFLLFLLIIVISVFIVVIATKSNSEQTIGDAINGQQLSKEELSQLKGTESKIGDPKQTLNIESNAVFSGKVLVRDSLDVAGTIHVGGALALPGISVSGTSSFDQITANNLSIAGNTSIQGQLNVQKNLTVAGGGSFAGPISAPSLSIDKLSLNQDIQLNRHIDAGGSTPRASGGAAVGNGGTVSVSGSDTAGTVTINTGGSPPAGVLATVTFTNSFSQTPHVVITAVGSTAAGLGFYVNRTSSGFSIGVINAPPAGVSFSFDFVAID